MKREVGPKDPSSVQVKLKMHQQSSPSILPIVLENKPANTVSQRLRSGRAEMKHTKSNKTQKIA